MASPRLYLLGSPVIERDRHPVEVSSHKLIALLAYLAISQVERTRDQVMGFLWPESAGEAARKNLRNMLWLTRKTLDQGILLLHGERLSLDTHIWVDVRAFEDDGLAVETRIDLYRGPLLDGVSVRESPEFEIWLTTERERLGQQYMQMASVMINQYRTEGRWADVIRIARRALDSDNLQEPVYRALMEAHARLGERVEAIRQYEALRRILERELGVEPLSETETLYRAIQQGELESSAGASLRTLPISKTAHRPYGSDAKGQRGVNETPGQIARLPFIGRAADLSTLDAELQYVTDGSVRVVAITGELGIGKSRLWEEWSGEIPLNLTLLEARCLEVTRMLPFATLGDLFRSSARSRGLITRASRISPVWLAELARLLPEINDMASVLPPAVGLQPEGERLRIFEAFTQLLIALDAQPLILFIDDLHWADQATLDWLGYLVNRMREASLLLVVAYRPQEAPSALIQLIAGWGRQQLLRKIELAYLTEAESIALITALVSDPVHQAGLVKQIPEQCAGNPYYLVELCRAAPGQVPQSLGELLRARFSRFPETAQQVLQAAAVLGADFDLAALRHTSGRGTEEVLDALELLINAALLREKGKYFHFTHPFIGTVVRDGLIGARRTFISRRAAQALEASFAGRLPQVAGRLAVLYREAEAVKEAVLFAEMAGERALSLAAFAEAASFFAQALDLVPTPERELALGQALYLQGQLAEAQVRLESAYHQFREKGDLRGAAKACLSIADAYLRSGRVEEIQLWAGMVFDLMGEGDDPEAYAFAHHLIGAAYLHMERPLDDAEMHLQASARLASEYGLPAFAARSRFGLAGIQARRGDLKAAVAGYQLAILLAKESGDVFHEILGHNNAAYHTLLLGDLALAKEHIEAGLALSEARALAVVRQWLYSTRGEIALAESQWDEAQDWFERGLKEAEKHGNPEMVANYRANLGRVSQRRGEPF
jgi:DNA-binding SARP family transcriptional activator